MSLTDREIRNIAPTTKRQRYFDERGLYLEVAPSGGKWWRFKYRFAGKEKRLSLGVYPEIGLKEARIAWCNDSADRAKLQDCRNAAQANHKRWGQRAGVPKF